MQDKRWAVGGMLIGLVALTGCMNQSHTRQQDKLFQAEAQAMPKRTVSQYQRVGAFLAKHPVYISLTSSPSRIKHLPAVLDTIDKEHVTGIVLNIPDTYARTGEQYVIPDTVRRYPKLQIHRMREDHGPISKILPTVEWAMKQDPEAIVIAIDDDVAYPAGLVNEHLYALIEKQGSVSAANIRKLYDRWPVEKTSLAGWPDSDYSVVQGFASIAYRAKEFPASKMLEWLAKEKLTGQKNCFLSDDLVISYGLAYAGVSAHKITTPYLATTLVKMFSFSQDKGAISQTDKQSGAHNPNDARLIACYNFLVGLH
jgi:hypothetical protein